MAVRSDGMAAATDILTSPPIFTSGSGKKTLVSLSSAGHNSSPLLSSQSPAAKDMLLQVQRGETKTKVDHKPLLIKQDKFLAQKGILLSIPTPQNEPFLRTKGSPRRQYNNTKSSPTTNNNVILSNNDRLPNLITMNSSLLDGPGGHLGSPDSGYEDLTGLAARNRSSTADTSSSVETSSRTNSNITGHDSELELVREEEEEEEREEEEEERETTSSNNSDNNKARRISNATSASERSDSTASFIYPFPTFDDPVKLEDSFYHPDDETIIQVAPRRGIQRSNSTEEHSGRRVSMDEGNRRKSAGGRGGVEVGGRNRSTSLFTKDTNHITDGMDSKDTFQIQDQLSKENYHFMLSDALMSVIEEYKSLLREQEYDEHLTTLSTQSIDSSCPNTSPDILLTSSLLPPSTPSPTPSSSTTQLDTRERNSVDSPTLYRHQDVSLLRLVDSPSMANTAESTAHGLLQHIARVLGGASSIEFRVPQIVQLPSDFIASLKREEQLHYSVNSNSTPIRGGIDWAPPRKTIIHTVHKPASAKDLPDALSRQGNRCAGCGMIMDVSQSKLLRFCYYIGKYFCTSCHQNSLSPIPAYIISTWVFKRLPVSNFARDTLAEIEKEPHFNLESLNPTLYYQVSELKRMKDSRIQLHRMQKYIKNCRRDSSSLCDQFTQLGHIASDIHSYSVDDFYLVKSGFLLKHVKLVIRDTEKHIKTCSICKDQGFVCEFCRNFSDILYPFELDRISQCSKCSCCFHRDCFNAAKKSCPRCKRLKERQQQRIKTMLIADDD